MQDTLTNIFNKTTNSDLGLFGTLTSRTYNATATAQDFNKIFENLNIQTGEKSKNLTTNPMSEKNIYEKDFSNLTREPNKNTKNITDSKNGFNRNNNLKETTSSDFEKQDKTNSTKYVSDDNSTSDAKNVK